MKNLMVLFLAYFALTNSAIGQFISKGRFLIGGSGSFSATASRFTNSIGQETTGSSASFSFSPSGAYLVTDNLAVGGRMELQSSASKTDDVLVTGGGRTIGPLVRYYLKPGIFFQGYYGYGRSLSEFDDNNGTVIETKTKTGSFQLSIGYAYFINDHVALEPSVGLRRNRRKDSYDNVTIDTSLFLNLGFQIYLGARKSGDTSL